MTLHGEGKRQWKDPQQTNPTNLPGRDFHPDVFPLMKLPLEIRRMVYAFTDFKASTAIDVKLLRKYINGRETQICGFIDTNSVIRAEAFEYVLSQNTIDLVGLKISISTIDRYIARTQIPGFNFFRHVTAVEINLRSAQSASSAKDWLPACQYAKVVTVNVKRSWHRFGALVGSGSIWAAVDQIPSVKRFRVRWIRPQEDIKLYLERKTKIEQMMPVTLLDRWQGEAGE